VARVPVLRHRLRVLSAENQLQQKYDAAWNGVEALKRR
jgi:hypothetical protein